MTPQVPEKRNKTQRPDDGSSGMESCEHDRVLVNNEGSSLLGRRTSAPEAAEFRKEAMRAEKSSEKDNGRERLKRHRIEVAGRVWIPEIWGQEELLKDWIDCSAFDASLVPSGIISARAALVEEGRRANSGGFRIANRIEKQFEITQSSPGHPLDRVLTGRVVQVIVGQF